MAFQEISPSPDPNEQRNAMRQMFGPQQVDQTIRQAIGMCWMMLPDEKKNPGAVATEIRRIVDRALVNLAEDAAAFGLPTEGE